MKKRENRTDQIRVNVTPNELIAITEAAKRNNMTISAFSRYAINQFNQKQVEASNKYYEAMAQIVSEVNLVQLTGDVEEMVQEVMKIWQSL